MSFLADYFKKQQECIIKYGDKTVLLIQKGIFYEIYEYNPEYDTGLSGGAGGAVGSGNTRPGVVGNAYTSVGFACEVSEILTTDLTMCNKSKPYSRDNPHMTGFPTISYEKNKAKLLAHNYSLVRLDQTSTGAGTEREIVEICNPSLDLESSNKMSNIMVLYIENQSPGGVAVPVFDNLLLTVGVAVIDILSGQNKVSEFYSKIGDEIAAIQELFRFLISHAPRELIIHIDDLPESYTAGYTKYLEKNLQLARFERVTILINKIPVDYKKSAYQEEFLHKVFNPTTGGPVEKKKLILKKSPLIHAPKKSMILDLNLEHMNYGKIAYITALQFCYNFDPQVVARIDRPNLKWLDQDRHCILTHNAIVQLDLIDAGKPKGKKITSLMSIVDQTITKSGHALLLNLFQNPLIKQADIEEYYNLVDAVSSVPDKSRSGSSNGANAPSGTAVPSRANAQSGTPNNFGVPWKMIEQKLKELGNIELLQRKLTIGNITPKEVAMLYNNYLKFLDLYIYIVKLNNKYLNALCRINNQEFNNFIQIYGDLIDFTALETCYLTTAPGARAGQVFEFITNPFPLSVSSEELEHREAGLQEIIEHLNELLEKTRGAKIVLKIPGGRKKETSITALTTTKAKSRVLLNAEYDTNLCGELRAVSLTTAEDIITSDVIEELTTNIEEIKTTMKQELLIIFQQTINDMRDKYTFHKDVINFIAKIDVIHCYAKIAHLNEYYRPQFTTAGSVAGSVAGAGCAVMKDLRHPIIEKLIDNKYITNDIELSESGILLYGVNQTGKSSLAKSIALNIIMAQAGCFTACRLVYRPYHKIITRLSGNDNIFADQSSFAVEMAELRTILRQSDQFTLVIGDELARGTESDSATALTVATVNTLIQSRTSFIFATHMHHLTNLKPIKELKNLRICHLAVTTAGSGTAVSGSTGPLGSVGSGTGPLGSGGPCREKILIYDRKLKEGPGSSIYGIMVAESLNLPSDFIAMAKNFLHEQEKTTELVSLNKSKYNRNLYVDCCIICGSKDNLETHHILPQRAADEKSYIDHMHKNKKDNLIILCKECHKNIDR